VFSRKETCQVYIKGRFLVEIANLQGFGNLEGFLCSHIKGYSVFFRKETCQVYIKGRFLVERANLQGFGNLEGF